jgi:hypothetical protein
MGSEIFLADREDFRKIEIQEQQNFILSILFSLGLPKEELDNCLVKDKILSVEDKIKLIKLCENFQISIIDDTDGGIKIYVRSDNTEVLVAEWYKSNFILRIDHSMINRNKKLFVEIHTKWWSMFEEENG